MKAMYFYLIISLTLNSNLFSQEAILVSESTFKISGVKTEKFYFGLCEGDQLIFDLEILNGKELNKIEIKEFPHSSKFMDFKTKGIKNKVLNIRSTAIYEFSFTNSAIGKRVCKYRIKRIPASPTTANFNTSVYSKTIFDTTYTIVQEEYLISENREPKKLIPKSTYYINSGTHSMFKGGKSRISIPINLPRNTIEWYYQIAAFRDPGRLENAKESLNLLGNISNIFDPSGATEIGIKLLTGVPGSDVCDVFLLDAYNKLSFESKNQYSYWEIGTRENIKEGIVKINKSIASQLYIGIKNPDSYHGIHVLIEVVAIVLQQEWGTREIKKPNIKSIKIPYLKN